MRTHIPKRSIWFLFTFICLALQIGFTQSLPDKKDLAESNRACSGCPTITELLIYNQDSANPINKTTEIIQSLRINMEPADTHFELRFAGTSPQIAYYLEGIDKTWHYPGDNLIRLYRLPADSYQLRVRGKDAAGNWTDQYLTLQLEISRPYAAVAWLPFLYFLLLIGAVSLGLWQVHLRRKSQIEMRARAQQLLDRSRELAALNTAKSNMFIDIVHEIRSPLSLVMGLNEAIKLERYGRANPNIKGASRIALRNGNQLVKLTNEMLELSRLEQIEVSLEEKPVHFQSYVHGLYSMVQPCAALKKISLQFHYAVPENLHISLDLTKFEKIFNNLLSNAIKFTPEQGCVQVAIQETETGAGIQVSVKDSGAGIPQKDLPHIFERYYQSEYKQLFGGYGTGIGLALAKHYADLFEGKLTVESEWGKGSLFTFTFPKKEIASVQESDARLRLHKGEMAEAENPELPGQEIPEEKAADNSDLRVLLVEDNADMLQFLKELVQPHYAVSLAKNGQEALKILLEGKEKIDLVVSDVIMPEVDGFELLNKVRADDRWRGLPFLMLTAEVRASQRISAFTFGVDDYLIKPFSTDELLVRIHALLRNATRRSSWKKKHVDGQTVEPMATNDSAAVKMTAAELDWLKKLEETVSQELSNRQFNILEMASTMAVSERQLFRRIKRLTGMTPNNYLRDMKLNKAKEFLEDYTYGTISEVSYAVGFEDPHYFSKIYADRFGKKPSEYLVRYTAASS